MLSKLGQYLLQARLFNSRRLQQLVSCHTAQLLNTPDAGVTKASIDTLIELDLQTCSRDDPSLGPCTQPNSCFMDHRDDPIEPFLHRLLGFLSTEQVKMTRNRSLPDQVRRNGPSSSYIGKAAKGLKSTIWLLREVQDSALHLQVQTIYFSFFVAAVEPLLVRTNSLQ
ncbi:MAG: hypothetical protein AAGI22_05745 [Planctomycetota bacterium]